MTRPYDPVAAGIAGLTCWRDASWLRTVKEYYRVHNTKQIKEDCTNSNISTVNKWFKNMSVDYKLKTMKGFGSDYTPPLRGQPAHPIFLGPRNFHIFKVKGKSYCHRDLKWDGFEVDGG